jgi:hypothetical protein
MLSKELPKRVAGEKTGRKTNENECGVVRTRVVTRNWLVGWLAGREAAFGAFREPAAMMDRESCRDGDEITERVNL